MSETHNVISCGCNHSLIIDFEGNAWSFGQDSSGQTGRSNYKYRPHKIPGLKDIVSVSGGSMHSSFLDVNGAVIVKGQLGFTHRDVAFENIPPMSYVNSHGMDAFHAIDLDGSVWTAKEVGANLHSKKIGLVKAPDSLPFIQRAYPSYLGSYLIDIDKNVWTNSQPDRFIKIEELTGIVEICASRDTTLFLDSDGKVFSRTAKRQGMIFESNEPRVIEGIPPMKHIAAGTGHFLFIDVDNQAWGFGENAYGQIGINQKTAYNEFPFTKILLESAQAISCGDKHSLVLDGEGVVWSFGFNQYGQLGIGESSSKFKPEKVALMVEAKSIAVARQFKSARLV